MSEQNRRRMTLMMAMMPRLFREPGNMLYIGAYTQRFHGSPNFIEAGHKLTVVEIWPYAVEQLRKLRPKAAIYIEGDVREIDKLELPYEKYDYTAWLHGPEHVGCHEFVDTLRKLEALTDKCLVMTCPWGLAPHGIADRGDVAGNPHTQHRCFYYPEMFTALKYEVAAIGPKNRMGSQLMGWKWLGRV